MNIVYLGRARGQRHNDMDYSILQFIQFKHTIHMLNSHYKPDMNYNEDSDAFTSKERGHMDCDLLQPDIG